MGFAKNKLNLNCWENGLDLIYINVAMTIVCYRQPTDMKFY